MRILQAVLLCLVIHPAMGQTPADPPKPTVAPPGPALRTGDPYIDQEFAPWERKLRRFEILTVGAFPIVYLFSGIGFDYYYYFSHGYPNANIPWPLGPGTSQWLAITQPTALQNKNVAVVSASLAASFLVALADWALGL